MGLTRLAMFPRLAASLLPLVYSLFFRYGARVWKPTAPEQLYIDFDESPRALFSIIKLTKSTSIDPQDTAP